MSARSEKSWAIPIREWITSKPFAAWATSSPGPRSPRSRRPVTARLLWIKKRPGPACHEKPVPQDFSVLLGGAGALRGAGHTDHRGHARTRRVGHLGRATIQRAR